MIRTVLIAIGATTVTVFALVFGWAVLQERRSKHLAASLDWHEAQECGFLSRDPGERP